MGFAFIILAILVILLWRNRAPYDRAVRVLGSGDYVKYENNYLYSQRKLGYAKVNFDSTLDSVPYEDRFFITWVKSQEEASLFNIYIRYNRPGDYQARLEPVEYEGQSIYVTFDTNTNFPVPIFSKKNIDVKLLSVYISDENIAYPTSIIQQKKFIAGTIESERKYFVENFFPTFDGFGYKPCVIPSETEEQTCISYFAPVSVNKSGDTISDYLERGKKLYV